MPTTPVYGLPYPLPTDPADGPVAFENLAEAVEAQLGGPPVSALPGVPQDGQIVRYKVGANGPVWTFQYLAASAAPYRWHAIGAPAPLAANIAAVCQRSGPFGYADPGVGTPGPAFTLPLAGEYRFAYTVRAYNGASGVACHALVAIAGAPIAAEWAIVQNSGGGAVLELTQSRQDVPGVAASAGAEAKLVYSTPTAGTGTWYDRALSARPVRVG
jgi:hypothetical protein